MNETKGLQSLGNKTEYMFNVPDPNTLEVFQNQHPNRPYVVEYIFNEFTSLCPRTGQPDFAMITVRYVPGEYCIETKSLKLYYFSYRQYGSFMETIVNRILDDLVNKCSPKWMEVLGNFNPRGGTITKVISEHGKRP